MANELVKVPFYGDELDAVQDGGKVWVSLRRCCENLGLTPQGQLEKLKRKAWACVTEIVTQMPGDTQAREVSMIDLETLPGWLFSIDARKVAGHIREKLARYQREAAQVLARHFLGGQPTAPPGNVSLSREQFDLLVNAIARIPQMEQRIEELAASRQLNAVHVPTNATPRFTVLDRLRFKEWSGASAKQRALIRRQANIWLALRHDETPDVCGGAGGPCVYYGHQIVVLDEAIDFVRESVRKREQDAGPNLFSDTKPN